MADPAKLLKAISVAMDNLVKLEPEITEYDTVAGDGDCGLTLKGGAEGKFLNSTSSLPSLMLNHTSYHVFY